jgi:hypothetical protein
MQDSIKTAFAALALTLSACLAFTAATRAAMPSGVKLAQAVVPATGVTDAKQPTPMEQRYLDRYPQPARVGDLIGLPVLNLNASTLGDVRQIVRTKDGKIELIVAYSWWWGWFGRPVAVPLEAVGIQGRQFVSLDMTPAEYAAAPTWRSDDATILPADATIRVALARE